MTPKVGQVKDYPVIERVRYCTGLFPFNRDLIHKPSDSELGQVYSFSGQLLFFFRDNSFYFEATKIFLKFIFGRHGVSPFKSNFAIGK